MAISILNHKWLAEELLKHHAFKNGCWYTDYSAIRGLNLLATTTNGTSGIGIWHRRRVYWNYEAGKFKVTYA